MFISHQTYEGLQITVFSTIEATKYLLQHGSSYVLTENSIRIHWKNILEILEVSIGEMITPHYINWAMVKT